MNVENENVKSRIEQLESEIPELVGEKREEAKKIYRKLLSDSKEEPIYLARL